MYQVKLTHLSFKLLEHNVFDVIFSAVRMIKNVVLHHNIFSSFRNMTTFFSIFLIVCDHTVSPFPSATLPMFSGLKSVSELEIQSTEMFLFDDRYVAFTSNLILPHILSWRNFSGRERESKEPSQGQKCVSAHFKHSLKPNFKCISFKCDRKEISHEMITPPIFNYALLQKTYLMYMKQRNLHFCSNIVGLVWIFLFHNSVSFSCLLPKYLKSWSRGFKFTGLGLKI